MADDKLENAYAQLLHHGRLRGDVAMERDDSERRSQPRLRVDTGDIQVNADPWAILIDLSSTGLAYHSDTPPEIGTTVSIGLDDGFSVSAEVVQLRAEEEEESAIAMARGRRRRERKGKRQLCVPFHEPRWTRSEIQY